MANIRHRMLLLRFPAQLVLWCILCSISEECLVSEKTQIFKHGRSVWAENRCLHSPSGLGIRLRGGNDVGQDTSDQDKALLDQLQGMKNECNVIAQRISSLEQERDDHDVVQAILGDFPPARRCYRSVGGILMERTVADVVPEIRSEWGKLSKAIQELANLAQEKHRAIEAFQAEHSIRIVRGSPGVAD
uniref:Prefoldin subunit 2 n=1 Tax=Cryptomonas curvata TaxID=233186 RepID=A0A7S0LVU9_9CRYP|mmetsp:Transcript_12412/g.26653  ORF Transcript_12412/g.26653 Transcript_12412/m.26653 type:complete len:189 (+) Transcript_12412:167-733(+)